MTTTFDIDEEVVTDLIADAISDGMDCDWTARDGARSAYAALEPMIAELRELRAENAGLREALKAAKEMRELKERFSDLAGRAVKHLDLTYYNKGSSSQTEREAIVAGLTDFIIPAPAPLVEAWKEAWAVPHNSSDKLKAFSAAMQARGYEWRKIGEAGE